MKEVWLKSIPYLYLFKKSEVKERLQKNMSSNFFCNLTSNFIKCNLIANLQYCCYIIDIMLYYTYLFQEGMWDLLLTILLYHYANEYKQNLHKSKLHGHSII